MPGARLKQTPERKGTLIMIQSPKALPCAQPRPGGLGTSRALPVRSSRSMLGTWSLVCLLLAACGQEPEQTQPDQSGETEAQKTQSKQTQSKQTRSKQTGADETPYGSLQEVEDYLRVVSPFIQEIVAVQQQYEQGLASAGSNPGSRRGTGENLADTAAAIRPRLLNLLDEFGNLEPPPLLAPFHRDTKQLIVARLDAYGATISGWEAEGQASS